MCVCCVCERDCVCVCELTGVRQVQVCPAGGEDSGVDAGDHVGLVHDEVYHVMVTGQLTLGTGTDTGDLFVPTRKELPRRKGCVCMCVRVYKLPG